MRSNLARLIQFILLPGFALGIFVLFAPMAWAAPACQLATIDQTGQVSRYRCSERLSATVALQYLQAQPGVKVVGLVRQYQIALIPNDTYYAEQRPYLEKVRAHEAWETPQADGLRPIIAVLDTGVDGNNPDLAPNMWFNPWEVPGDRQDNDNNGFVDDQYGWDFVQNIAGAQPRFETGWNEVAMQHGTIVAGVAAAAGNNAMGVTGVAWRARIMPVRVLDSRGIGNTVTVAKGIDYAVRNHADIINLSFVGSLSDPILEDAISRAYRAGVLVVAAAGNEAAVGVDMNKLPQYPVCDDGFNAENQVIGVAAVDTQDKLAEFSNYGSRCIDISAPGTGIFSTQFVDQAEPKLKVAYGGYWSGTSVAAPLVSGTLALLKSQYPRLSPSQLRDVVMASGDLIDSQNSVTVRGGLGRRLNIKAALSLAASAKFPKKSPLLIAAQSGRSEVATYDISGEQLQQFLAYYPAFLKGVNVAGGDVDGDGQVELVTVARQGGGPHVKIFNQQGEVEFQFMAFPERFRGGLSLAVADITGNHRADIVVGVGVGGSNLVRVFDALGNGQYQFIPYDPSYTGGINVAVGDVDGDGLPEFVTSPMGDARLPIRVFDRQGVKKAEFAAYATVFRGGVNLAVGDVDGDGLADIVTAPGAGGGPQVRVYSGQGKLLREFFAYAKTFRGGVNLAVGDVDGDGLADIVTAPGTGGGPHVRVWNEKGEVKSQFFAGAAASRTGISVATFR